MDDALPEPFHALTDPDLLWEVLRSLPLRVTVIDTDDGVLKLVASDVTGGRMPLAPGTAAGLDLRRAFDRRQVAFLEEALAAGRCTRFTAPIELPDGSIRVVDGTNVPLPDGRVLSFTYNLTDHVAEVHRAQEYAAAILRVTPDRFWVTSRDLTIRHYEGPADWRTPAGSIGRNMADVYPPELVDRFRGLIDATLETGEIHTVVAEAVLEPGLVYETQIVPFGTDDVLLAARDVTEFHRTQRTSELRAQIEAISSRVLRELFDLVGPPLVDAADALVGLVADAIGADTATLGRRLDDGNFERFFVWTRPEFADSLARIPRVIEASQLPDAFMDVAEADAIVVRSADSDSLGPLAQGILDSVRAQSALIVPLQSAEYLMAYMSFYWFDRPMPEVEAVLSSIRSVGTNLLAAARRGEAEAAQAEATEQLERAHEALRANEERFRLMSRATNDVLWDWDLTTDLLWWGDGITTLFGYQRTELDPTIRSWEQCVHPDDVDRVLGSIRASIDGGARSWASEYRFVHRRGGYLWVLDRGEILHDDEGRPIRMVGGMRDVTERRRTESLLREQARLLDAANDVIYERDLEGRIVYWNRAAERTYGWTADDVMGRSVIDLLHVDPDGFRAATEAVLRDGEWSGELRQRRADGEEMTVESRLALVRDELGQPKSVVVISTDVTERRALERQLLRAQRMESIGTLAGGIAHDLNNVLTPILMTTELLQADESDESRRESLGAIELAAQRGADLVRQVLSFARGGEVHDEDVDLHALFGELSTFLTETFPRNIAVRFEAPDDPLVVAGDNTQLAQVLLNLCVNARDAMPDGGELLIAAERRPSEAGRPERVVIIVADSGTGIAPDIADRVFEPFFTTKPIGSGTGLGLATAMAIVEASQGTLEFRGRRGGGTMFSVTLPAASAGPPRTDERRPPPVRGNGEVVLVVDDEGAILSTLRQVLRRHGYEALTALDGDSAVRIVADADPPVDLVITDLMMPGLDGVETAAAIRAIRPETRIVVASGVKTDDAMERVSAAGIAHFLAKPYSVETLLDTLRAALA